MRDVVIVGGGLAGGAAAVRLAREGLTPLLLEREREPRDKMCGEFLSVEALAYLKDLGLDPLALGGVNVDKVRFVIGAQVIEARLPFKGVGLRRRTLDAALLDHARALGAKVERGVSVRGIRGDALETSQGNLTNQTILLASGKHEVKGAKRDTSGALRGMIGFKTYYKVTPDQAAELDGYAEVILFDGGYAGFMPIDGGVVNLCLLVGRERFEEVGGRWSALLEALLREPHMARRLEGGEAQNERPLTIFDVPYGFIHQSPSGDCPHLFRMGDQAAVIPSYAGDGMAIALHSSQLAVQAVLAGGDAGAYHRRLRADVTRQVKLATWLQKMADTPLGRNAIFAGLGVAPQIVSLIASMTRIPQPALRRAGLGV